MSEEKKGTKFNIRNNMSQNGQITPSNPNVTEEDYYVHPSIRENLEGIVVTVSHIERFGTEMGHRNYLFTGHPGTGKNLGIKYLASRLKVPLYDGKNVSNSQQISQLYQQLRIFNSELKKYHNEGIDLQEFFLKKLVWQGEEYLESKIRPPIVMKIGDKVRVKSEDDREWNSDYFNDRRRVIPIDSVGKLLFINYLQRSGNNNLTTYFVRFDDTKEFPWRRKFKGIKYYQDKYGYGENIALYRAHELAPMPSINDVEKHLFQVELDKTRGYVMDFYKD